MCFSGVCLRPHLAAAVLRVDVSRHGEARVQQLLGVVHRSLKQVFEVLVLGHVLIAGLPPLSHSLTERRSETHLYTCTAHYRGSLKICVF